MDFMDVVRTRYSVRKFDHRAVEGDKIMAILEAARLAPTAVNKQPHRILVLEGPEDMAKLAKCTQYTFNAPDALVVCADESAAWVRPCDKENSGTIDASIVGTFIMLTICDLGLGTCWVGHFEPDALRSQFNLPPNIQPVAIFPLGYAALDCRPARFHDQRLPMDEIVKYHSF